LVVVLVASEFGKPTTHEKLDEHGCAGDDNNQPGQQEPRRQRAHQPSTEDSASLSADMVSL
jgi:hypothetical protein